MEWTDLLMNGIRRMAVSSGMTRLGGSVGSGAPGRRSPANKRQADKLSSRRGVDGQCSETTVLVQSYGRVWKVPDMEAERK